MRLAIDGSRAFIKERTGIEEYSYQTIKHLRHWLKEQDVFLYIRHNQEVDFDIPEKWKIKKLWFPRFWTQIRLSLAMITDSIDGLFIPAHTVPFIHPKKTIVVIHGLEYEFCPEGYSWLERTYMRFVIKNSCKWASNIVCVSENTKRDLEKLYGILSEKITVIYEGYNESMDDFKNANIENKSARDILESESKYLFFVGRIEKRKNISNIIKAFEILKSKYGISHKLVLAGKPGHGYVDIAKNISKSVFRDDILEPGYINDNEKWALLRKADIFVFPSFYEGFGLPILEAQKMLVPVVTTRISSIPEVAGQAALYSEPEDYLMIAENMHVLIKNEKAREDMVKRGVENLRRFSWVDCAKSLANVIKD